MSDPTNTIIPRLTQRFARCLWAAGMLAAAGTAQVAIAAPLEVSHCWIRAMPGSLPSAGYFAISNAGDAPVALTGVKTSAFGMAMLHQTQMQSGTAHMVKVDKVSVPAHGKFTFSPGGYHVMLERPTHPLKIGALLPLTFIFGDNTKVIAICQVKPASAIN